MSLPRYTELRRRTPLRNTTPIARTGIARAATPRPRATQARAGKTTPATDIPTALRRLVIARDLNRCVRCGRDTTGIPRSIQHRQARGHGGRIGAHTAANLILLCGTATTPGSCHAYAEDRTNWDDTTHHGWVVSQFAPDPSAIPVFVHWLGWCQPGQEWKAVSP